jgi:hypothetical protein
VSVIRAGTPCFRFVVYLNRPVNLYIDRYYVPGATGKEVAIFDLHANTSALPSPRLSSHKKLIIVVIVTASNIIARNISAVTADYAPVAVMCDSKTVSFSAYYSVECNPQFGELTLLLGIIRCWIRVSGRAVHRYGGGLVRFDPSHITYDNIFLKIKYKYKSPLDGER